MVGIEYSELSLRLTADAVELFMDMTDAHVAAGSGDRFFIRSDTMGGTGLHFVGPQASKSWHGFDGGAIEDLVSWGLLHVRHTSRGTANYRISGEGQLFYRWLKSEMGSPIEQTENIVRSLLDGAVFAARHPGASHHLREAFSLLWSDRTNDQTISEIGDHLRKSLMDLATDFEASAGIHNERPVDRLELVVDTLEALGAREVKVLQSLVQLVRDTLSLDHRLNHIRDETGKGFPLRAWDEARRAAFITAVVCYELSAALDERQL